MAWAWPLAGRIRSQDLLIQRAEEAKPQWGPVGCLQTDLQRQPSTPGWLPGLKPPPSLAQPRAWHQPLAASAWLGVHCAHTLSHTHTPCNMSQSPPVWTAQQQCWECDCLWGALPWPGRQAGSPTRCPLAFDRAFAWAMLVAVLC